MDMRGRGVNGSTSSDQTVFVFGGDNGDLYIRSSGKEQKQVTVVSKPGDKWSGVEVRVISRTGLQLYIILTRIPFDPRSASRSNRTQEER